MNEDINSFINKRPEVVACYGYGSGIFKQIGYTAKDKPQIDLIFVVDDLKEWHKKNIKLNKNDYSMIGKAFFKSASLKKLKGTSGITYLSNIKENHKIYKYGTIEYNDLVDYLGSWKSFYMPGRFQKPTYVIKDNYTLTKMIQKNRENALYLSLYLQDKDEVTKKEVFNTLCSLSYIGDTRMKFAENPRKVLNIVEGSFNKLDSQYKFDKKYVKVDSNKLIINRKNIDNDINKLPNALYQYIKPYLKEDKEVIVAKIYEYFEIINKKESLKQTVKGIFTNGVVRSVSYASKKIVKRFKK